MIKVILSHNGYEIKYKGYIEISRQDDFIYIQGIHVVDELDTLSRETQVFDKFFPEDIVSIVGVET